ncbi:MAG: hypothetical protein NVSMB27_45220 [Ktedonobacteraceae bacterium]
MFALWDAREDTQTLSACNAFTSDGGQNLRNVRVPALVSNVVLEAMIALVAGCNSGL